MITVRRLMLPISLLCAVLPGAVTGCATPVPGEPIPAAGFHENHPTQPAQPLSTVTARATIPTPRNPDGIDPCGLLTPADLTVVGGPVGPPHRDNPVAGSCAQLLASGPENTAAAGFYDSYQDAASRQPRGAQRDVEGHSAWLYCERIDAHQTCTAATAIRPDRTLLTMLSMRDATAADTLDQLFQLTKAALHKLPPA